MEAAQVHQLQQQRRAQGHADDGLDTFLRIGSIRRILDNAGKSTVWRWIKAGRFPAPIVRDGNTVLWSLRQIQAWQAQKLAQQQRRAAA